MPSGDPQWVPGWYDSGVSFTGTAFPNNWTLNSSQNRGLEAPELGERWQFQDGTEATVMSVLHTISPQGRTIVCKLYQDDGTSLNMTPEEVWSGTYIPQVPDKYAHLLYTLSPTDPPTAEPEPVRLTSFERLLIDDEDD